MGMNGFVTFRGASCPIAPYVENETLLTPHRTIPSEATRLSLPAVSHSRTVRVRALDRAHDRVERSDGALALARKRHRGVGQRGGERYELHHQDLTNEQVGWWQAIPTATLPTAIGQCIDSGVPTYLLRQALEHGRRTGDVLADEAADLETRLEARHAE